MTACSSVTAVTTVTKKRDIPPLGALPIICSSRRTLSCSIARGDALESGYNGYSGYGEPDKESA
jgi:hypothetical protein